MPTTLDRSTLYPVAEDGYRHRTARWTGETRHVKKGEWFLSGAIVEAYYASADLSNPAPIAKLTRKTADAGPTYEGWRNRATWNVALHVNNEYALYRAACDYVQRAKDAGKPVSWTGFVAFAGLAGARTADGFKFNGKALDRRELSDMLRELV
jgi:hypothetical protein